MYDNEDCIKHLKTIEDNYFDSVVTDPPYELGFMGKGWDSTGIAFTTELWKEVYRTLKPGGYLLSFSASRNYHRMAVAIEDSGFEIRDQIMWLYGSGFPKSHNIGKAVDAIEKTGKSNPKALREARMGDDYEPTGQKDYVKGRMFSSDIENDDHEHEVNNEWEGWGTALKPAHEPICMARKPISEKSIVDNVLKHGTGGINIDGCRVGTEERTYDLKGGENLNKLSREGTGDSEDAKSLGAYGVGAKQKNIGKTTVQGRFPANLIHDGSEEVLEGFPYSKSCSTPSNAKSGSIFRGWGTITQKDEMVGYEGDGSAARFFYCPKVSKNERNRGLDDFEEKKTSSMSGRRDPHDMGKSKIDNDVTGRFVTKRKNVHPTVKPVELMKYLCRLVTPKGGTVLDPFMGSGSTGMAAKDEGFEFIGIEKEKEYFEIAEQRINTTSPLLDFL